MKSVSEMSIFDLVTVAQTLAASIEHDLPRNAEILRELCRRVVPIKLVPTRGKPMVAQAQAMPPLAPSSPRKVWCEQCDKRVDGPCASQFCKAGVA